MAAYVPRWGMQLTANWSESKAWAIYRMIQKKYAGLIGDREPIVMRSRGIGLGQRACATTSASPTTTGAIWKNSATSSSPPAAPAWC